MISGVHFFGIRELWCVRPEYLETRVDMSLSLNPTRSLWKTIGRYECYDSDRIIKSEENIQPW